MKKKYQGVVVPLVTPLKADFSLDREALASIVTNLYRYNCAPFIMGTTGEAASLPYEFKKEYIQALVKLKKEDSQLYAGISSNCVQESVQLARYCFEAGIDAVAATLPSYYKLEPGQMKNYFLKLADEVGGPLIVYNIPGTTQMSIPLAVIEELSYHPNIAGVKDSERSDERLEESLRLWALRSDFSYFLGWAARSAKAMLLGGDGIVPSTGNLHPQLYQQLLHAVEGKNEEKAYLLQKHSDLLGGVYQNGRLLGDSLAALKMLMKEFNLCQPYVMPPLEQTAEAEVPALKEALHNLIEAEGIDLKKD